MKKKTIIAIAAAAAVCVIGAVVGIKLKGSGGEASGAEVYADNVGLLTGTGLSGQNRFAGVVESQNTLKIAKDSDKTIKEIYVEKGDTVEPGTVLFAYDTDELNLKVEEAELKLESTKNTIDSYIAQIEQLKKEKKKASSSEQLSYTTQIQEAELAQKQAEYDYRVQEMETERLKKSVTTAEVTSTIAGVVQEINENPGMNYDTGEEDPFMAIRAVGKYQIKATISEQNIGEIYEGMNMVVHSRVDESIVWYGVIDTINTDQTVSNNNNYYYGGDSDMQASKYAFYITLDTSDGLMLGQHVFAEADNGMQEADGMWLPESYLVMDGDDAFVWAVNDKDKLEKRKVEIGEYNEAAGTYELLNGLTAEDYIVWPSEECHAGAAAYRNEGFVGGFMPGEIMEEESEGE